MSERTMRRSAKQIGRERRAVKTGLWGEWDTLPRERWPYLPQEGWLAEVHTVHRNRAFVVLVRDVCVPGVGTMQHLAIRNASSTDIQWAAKQRIKNEIVGEERVAVEVFPPVSGLVDFANMYHLWCYPTGYVMPFTLPERGK